MQKQKARNNLLGFSCAPQARESINNGCKMVILG